MFVRERCATECEQKRFPFTLSMLNSCCGRLAQNTIYTHKHAPNHWACAGSIRHLSSRSCAHTHTPASITHPLNIPDGPFSQLGVSSARTSLNYGPLSAFFFFLAFLSLYTWKVLFLNTRVKRPEYGGASVFMASQNRGWDAGTRSGSFSPEPSIICNANTHGRKLQQLSMTHYILKDRSAESRKQNFACKKHFIFRILEKSCSEVFKHLLW